MGGRGSGNRLRIGTKALVEDYRCLDVRSLQRAGYFDRSLCHSWRWQTDGKTTANIAIEIHNRHNITLHYRYRNGVSSAWVSVEQPLPIEWTKCHFGGERPWFICPDINNGVYCGRRVAKLYGAGKYFACRYCHDLTYHSRNMSADDRAGLKAERIRYRLAENPLLLEPFPRKPKGMHWKTYQKLKNDAEAAELRYWTAAASRLQIRI